MVEYNTLDLGGLDIVGEPQQDVTDGMVVKAISQMHSEYRNARVLLEETWKDCYASYIVTPEANAEMQDRAIRILGDVDTSWRHRLTTSKPFEVVETIVAYLQSALFPNNKYFTLTPTEPMPYVEWQQMVQAVLKFMSGLLKDAKFKSATELFLREVVINGISCMSFPWQEENASFTVLSPFEYWVDPHAQHINEAGFIRQYKLTKPEVKALIDDGTFNLGVSDKIEGNAIPYSESTNFTWETLGILPNYDVRRKEMFIYEYYGDLYLEEANILLKNIRLNWTNNMLLSMENNPYRYGKPFMLANYVALRATPYGMGGIQPVLPQMTQQNVIMSRRADNLSIASDTMFEVIDDGVVDLDQVYTAPGHKIPVSRAGTINPIQPPHDTGPSLQEEGVLEQRIDKAVGTGPYIGVGAGRSAERVTKAEIDAQREAGGNRLNLVYSHIEEQWFEPVLTRFYYYMKSYSSGGVVRLPLPASKHYMYVNVTPELLDFPMKVEVIGAGHVADKEMHIRNIIEWMNVVGQNPEMAQRVNWEAVLESLTRRMLPEDSDLFLSAPPQQAQQPQDLAQQAEEIGGPRLAENIQQQAATGQLQGNVERYARNLRIAGSDTA